VPIQVAFVFRISFDICLGDLTAWTAKLQERRVPFGLVHATSLEINMNSYVGPNGRLYKRERLNGKWVALTILAMALFFLVIAGVRTVADAFSYFGL
jgi:hypothetical protein